MKDQILKKLESSFKMALDSEIDPLYLGVELELLFCPSSIVAAKLMREWKVESMSKLRTISRDSIYRDIIIDGHLYEKPWVDRIYADGRLDEITFKPISTEIYRLLRAELTGYLNTIAASKRYVADSKIFEEIGIHHNIDLEFLTLEQFQNFMIYIFDNRKTILEISNRFDYSTRKADINYLLGDITHIMTSAQLVKRFEATLLTLSNAFKNKTEAQDMGIRVKPPIVEMRWWGSTLQSEIFFYQIDVTEKILRAIKENSRNIELKKLISGI